MKEINKTILFFALFVSAIVLASCSEDDNTTEEFPDWQNTNETYFENIYTTALNKVSAGDSTWKVLRKWSMNDSIAGKHTDYVVVQVLNKGTGSGCPLYTDSVRVQFEGRLIPSASYSEGYVFEKTWDGAYNFEINAAVDRPISFKGDGLATALQHMHIGDRWRVYIPYDLGYGSSDSQTGIPAYSDLIFDITLVAYFHPGAVIPTYKAKGFGWIEK